ncbi:hypothetical protein D9619_001577 [Psilocybe cf. subviscida]|uniref:TM7S3/TM198-like domain-containing protein n=1 Tax=Psilocybe cf. subviscida TaxID=2480587 RepID=A0A8H5BEZ3_9AGAR|nr:hypothetical protein D9619_001577 [Psilocybe cf. subviscida]
MDHRPSPIHPSSFSNAAAQAHNNIHRATRTNALPSLLYTYQRTLLVVILLAYAPLSLMAHPVIDSPDLAPTPLPPGVHTSVHTLVRRSYVVTNVSGVLHVIDPHSNTIITQRKGTDGSGKGFDAAAIIWIAFALAVGIPMAFAGVWGLKAHKLNIGRGRKFSVRPTTGVGVGLAVALVGWAALINSLSPYPISDAVIAIIILCFFAVPFVLGCSSIGRIPGIACIGIIGGFALGMRIVILRPNLLVQGNLGSNWAIISIVGLAGLVPVLFHQSQRWGLLFGCSSIGSFLLALGLDLILKKQDGMSRGLRYLFDRNGAHYLDIVVGGYNPPRLTQIILSVSIALIFVFAAAQNYIFKQDFLSGSRLHSDVVDSLSTTKSLRYPRTKPMFLRLDDEWDERPSSGIPIGAVVRTPVDAEKPPRSKLSYF